MSHPPFKSVEASRPPWDSSAHPHYTQTLNPSYTPGSGSFTKTESESATHVSIDPYGPNRPANLNYKLLISAITPRPIGFIATRSADGSTTNLSPFSFFNVVATDPPIFVVGLVGKGATGGKKDTLANIIETGECVINIISEDFIDAANIACVDAPYGVSEFDISGLTRADTEVVATPRVKEAVFSIEAKLVENREFHSKTDPTRVSSTMVVVEGVRFWAREDALNEERSLIDIEKLRPVARMGGITYARVTDLFELPRPVWGNDFTDEERNRFTAGDNN
ncbi:hypothetical protein BGW36DRAFT_460790 [Talaromyces proteolyticus]|uniref:Flavin reductase like domain-containing protein n=1 Tax=Talaromyces proteolyticus TaxID=1131652 RepID=A0AAD4Q1Y0_9EURO|nr:uncharacterized protein BGW36DRAFT_460790 [Talaromyces proteolyticus]KAH8698985.1 hypothetical protein BGW36DRAFT_460790 [Talaromyces proteolyticus]